jgi:hypothetical protein
MDRQQPGRLTPGRVAHDAARHPSSSTMEPER